MWVALFRLRLREFAVVVLTLTLTILPTFRVGFEPINWIQDELFQVYARYRIRAVPLEEFLSRCTLIDYVKDDQTRSRVGQCKEGFRSSEWFFFCVIYDPGGQLALPGYSRSIAWRLAVDDGFIAGSAIKKLDAKHLVGDFYYLKIYEDQW